MLSIAPVTLLLVAFASGEDAEVDYARDVKPLVAMHCVRCHGETKPRVGLRLDTARGMLAGGKDGPAISPGRGEESRIILSLRGEGTGERMPLKKPPLRENEIDLIRRWIDAGAVAPSDEIPSVPPVHWSLIPPVRPEPPILQNSGWIRNPIDRFILSPLEKDGITPSPEADRATLIRRATLDLLGLPPSPGEVEEFVQDSRPDAYERLVDRLLASPHYGERWGRLWLDGARYADSNGYSIDAPRSIWPYRDWVIDALNRDQPFDEFTLDQIAGDLRPDSTLNQKVATGFHRNTPINQEGGIDVEQFRIESIVDRVNTTATVWLGLTMGCCQCHDHKYDPLTQSDYYRFFAFFNNDAEPDLPIATPEQVARAKEVETGVADYLVKIAKDDPSLWERQKKWELSLDMVSRQKQSQEVRTTFDVVFEKRNDAQKQIVFAAFIDQEPSVKEHRQAIANLKKSGPKIVTSMVLADGPRRVTHELIGGDFTRPGKAVDAGLPGVFPDANRVAQSGDRLALARWLVDAKNPLTSRVMVNRLWMNLFGRGIVETENDFGTQGTPPTHPELLDWLATEFLARGWSVKAMQRLMLTSATYRQSSRVRPELNAIDADNRRLARQSRLRLDAELVRDTALASSGLLNSKIGGPSVFPPQPDGVMNFGQMRREWTTSEGTDRYRRGLYTYFWRATPHPMFTLFDAPDGTRACTRRLRSNTPLQALTLLNDEAYFEFAQALGSRVQSEVSSDDDRIERLFRFGLSRAPSDHEKERLRSLLGDLRKDKEDERVIWTTLARVMLNLDEFITRE